jgi:hypothetical protein
LARARTARGLDFLAAATVALAVFALPSLLFPLGGGHDEGWHVLGWRVLSLVIACPVTAAALVRLVRVRARRSLSSPGDTLVVVGASGLAAWIVGVVSAAIGLLGIAGSQGWCNHVGPVRGALGLSIGIAGYATISAWALLRRRGAPLWAMPAGTIVIVASLVIMLASAGKAGGECFNIGGE